MSHEAPLMVADSPAPLQAPVHWQVPVGAVLGSLPDASTTYPLVDIGAVLVLMSLVGAMIVGPFVVVLLTLPASVVWFVVFRIAWTRVRPARATS
jgi:hypothetical protein